MDVRVVESDLADAGRAVVPRSTLDLLAAKAPERALWVRTDHQHPAQVIADVKRATSSQLGLVVGGSLVQSAAVGAAVDAVLLVATALLGVAVLIAVIGVGATIGLSVIERVRESALLRALGVQRRQLRVMLAVEAGLLAVAATLVGVAAGIGFGVIGTTSLAHEIGVSQVRLAVSIPQTALVIAVALAAGLLASVLPGRRAARTEPAAVLADDDPRPSSPPRKWAQTTADTPTEAVVCGPLSWGGKGDERAGVDGGIRGSRTPWCAAAGWCPSPRRRRTVPGRPR